MYKWKSLLIVLALFISACSTVPPEQVKPRAKDVPKQIWDNRQLKFNTMKSWQVQGRVGLSHEGENWTFSLSWIQQNADDYEMIIKHPLTGRVEAHIKSTATHVVLTSKDGKRFRDRDAEALLQRQLGIGLPLKGMKYWIRGIASTESPPPRFNLDSYGRSTKMQQAGWNITFASYESDEQDALPKKIILEHPRQRTRVKMVIKNWKVQY